MMLAFFGSFLSAWNSIFLDQLFSFRHSLTSLAESMELLVYRNVRYNIFVRFLQYRLLCMFCSSTFAIDTRIFEYLVIALYAHLECLARTALDSCWFPVFATQQVQVFNSEAKFLYVVVVIASKITR